MPYANLHPTAPGSTWLPDISVQIMLMSINNLDSQKSEQPSPLTKNQQNIIDRLEKLETFPSLTAPKFVILNAYGFSSLRLLLLLAFGVLCIFANDVDDFILGFSALIQLVAIIGIENLIMMTGRYQSKRWTYWLFLAWSFFAVWMIRDSDFSFILIILWLPILTLMACYYEMHSVWEELKPFKIFDETPIKGFIKRRYAEALILIPIAVISAILLPMGIT